MIADSWPFERRGPIADDMAHQIGALAHPKMPDPQPLSAADLAVLAKTLPKPPPRCELRAHPDVIASLKAAYPPADGSPWMQYGQLGVFVASLDVTEASELGPGGWELLADGETIHHGRLTPGGPS